jgi:REase_MTES_1575
MQWDQVARRQGGAITRAQLRAVGRTDDRIDGMLAAAELLPTGHRGVFRAAGAPRNTAAQTWITVLATRSVLSYLSAAQWWGFPVESDGRIHVTRHDRQKWPSDRYLRVHRTQLESAAVTTWLGLPVTTRVETLLDCIGWLPMTSARTLLDRAFQQHWLSREQLQWRLDEQPGRWGNRRLSRLLQQSRPGAEAESERRLHRLLEVAGVLGWVGNYPIRLSGHSFRIDVAFPRHRIAIEVDGWAFHRTKERRDADILKTNALMAAGWRVLTFSWEDVTQRPDYVIATISALLVSQPVR